MQKDIPKNFGGIVRVDETYLGGQWKNKNKGQKRKEVKGKRRRGNNKQPVFGILCRDGRIWARIIDGVEKKDLQPSE
jgi:hypothetical protein